MSNEKDKVRAELMQEIAARGETVLHGVTNASGIGGAGSHEKDRWIVSIFLSGWRLDDKPIQECKLRIVRSVSKAEMIQLQSDIPSFSCISARVQVSDEEILGTRQIVFLEILKNHPITEAISAFA
jgi:hypothetical protein